MIRRLAIVGVGLLGGSVAKAVRAGGLAREIVGVGRDARRLEPALRDGVLDHATTDTESAVRGADFVLLAAPVLTIEDLLPRVWRHAPEGVVITDVGSTKGGIVRAADRLAEQRRLAFVGSHPMAGSEQSGYAVARADLFRERTVIVTPTDRTDPSATKAVTQLWEALGARVRPLDPGTHDRIVAAVSHLPHAVVYALVDATTRFDPEALELAASGFRDTTRIAASDPDMWTEIFVANREAVLRGLGQFRTALDDLERAIAEDARGELRAILARVRDAREALR